MLTFCVKLDGVTIWLAEAPWTVEDGSPLYNVNLPCGGLGSSNHHTRTAKRETTCCKSDVTSLPNHRILMNLNFFTKPLLRFVALSLASIKNCIPDLPLDSFKHGAVRTFSRLASCILTQEQNILTGCSTVLHNLIQPGESAAVTCAHVMLTDMFAPLVQSDTQGETLTRSHMHPCGADSKAKQESRQAKWSHTLVSSAVTLNSHVLGATLYNYRKDSRPLQLT